VDCQQCGYVFESVDRRALPERLRQAAAGYEAPLTESSVAALGHHRSADVWSPLEYGCHARDVVFNIRDRVLLALVEDNPSFSPIHREERVLLARYAEESPDSIVAGLRLGGDLLALVLSGLDADQWSRTGIYAGVDRDVTWIGRQALHELEHHLGDINGALANSGLAVR
jgi:hypothetical protein